MDRSEMEIASAQAQASLKYHEKKTDGQPEPFRQAVNRYMEETVYHRLVSGKKMVGLETGFSCLDEAFSGLRRGYYVLTGRHGRGKSSFAFQLAQQVSRINDIPALYVMYEGDVNDFHRRAVARANRIPQNQVDLPPWLSGKNLKEVGSAMTDLASMASREYPFLYIVDGKKDGRSPEDIYRLALKIKEFHRAAIIRETEEIFIVIDNLKRCRWESSGGGKRFGIEEYSGKIQDIVTSLKCPVLGISSVRISGSGFVDDESSPESGGIEDDCDYLLGFNDIRDLKVQTGDRPSEYEWLYNYQTKLNSIPAEKKGVETFSLLQVLKNRSGETHYEPTDSFPFFFEKQFAQFTFIPEPTWAQLDETCLNGIRNKNE